MPVAIILLLGFVGLPFFQEVYAIPPTTWVTTLAAVTLCVAAAKSMQRDATTAREVEFPEVASH